jgi:hypothetical protein
MRYLIKIKIAQIDLETKIIIRTKAKTTINLKIKAKRSEDTNIKGKEIDLSRKHGKYEKHETFS